MYYEHVHIYNQQLYHQAVKIFGDIIENASYGYSVYGDFDEYCDYLRKYVKTLDFDDEKTLEIPNLCTVILVFSNGNVVEFDNSEWAKMKNITEEYDFDYYRIN